MASEQQRAPIYGLMAEFETPESLIRALDRVQEEGYHSVDAFTPYPIEDVCHKISHHKKSKVPMFCLIGGLTGAAAGFGLQTWVSAIDYPLNIGGRPYFSWPAFIPVTFECTILFAAFSAVISMFALNGLPQPYHPVFNVESFERASQDRYFLVVESDDERFDRVETRRLLEELQPNEVNEVDW